MNTIGLTLTALSVAIALMPETASAREQPTPELQALDDYFDGDLVNDPTGLDWPMYGGLKTKVVPAKETPGQFGLRVTVPRAGAHPYDAGFNVPLTGPIAAGDRVTVRVWARLVSSDGAGDLRVRMQGNAAPYDGFGDAALPMTGEWTLLTTSAVATRALTPSTGVLAIQLAGQKQVVEIGQVYVTTQPG